MRADQLAIVIVKFTRFDNYKMDNELRKMTYNVRLVTWTWTNNTLTAW